VIVGDDDADATGPRRAVDARERGLR